MIVWSEKEPTIIDYDPENEYHNDFRKTMEKLREDIIKNDQKITVRDFYEQYLGFSINSPYLLTTELDGEFFINPDEWGWDKKGFRQLYRTRTIVEEL